MNGFDYAALVLGVGSILATGLIIFLGECQQRKLHRHSSPHVHHKAHGSD
jgi:hypothetical protein